MEVVVQRTETIDINLFDGALLVGKGRIKQLCALHVAEFRRSSQDLGLHCGPHETRFLDFACGEALHLGRALRAN